MRDIKEIWNELQQHPDFVTGRIHTKKSIVNTLDFVFEDLDEDFMRITELFVDENKSKIAEIIDDFELDNYQHGSWVDNMDDLIEEGKEKIFSYDEEKIAIEEFKKTLVGKL